MNQELTPKKSFKEEAKELLTFTLLVLAIIIPIRVFIAEPFIVNGESMLPTFNNGDYLIIDEISYKKVKPARGEVVVFRYPTNSKRFLIKRIIGLPGEKVNISGSKINITQTDGTVIQLDEDYLNGEFSTYGSWNISDTDYFVLGDNRQNSSDSRTWGMLNEDLIVGRTFLRLFPVNKIDLSPGKVEPEEIEIAL